MKKIYHFGLVLMVATWFALGYRVVFSGWHVSSRGGAVMIVVTLFGIALRQPVAWASRRRTI